MRIKKNKEQKCQKQHRCLHYECTVSCENMTNPSSSISRIACYTYNKIQHGSFISVINEVIAESVVTEVYSKCNCKGPMSLSDEVVGEESAVHNCDDYDEEHSGNFVAITNHQLCVRYKSSEVSRR